MLKLADSASLVSTFTSWLLGSCCAHVTLADRTSHVVTMLAMASTVLFVVVTAMLTTLHVITLTFIPVIVALFTAQADIEAAI